VLIVRNIMAISRDPSEDYPKLNKFDMRGLLDRDPENGKIITFIGKRNTGKSWAVRDFLYNNRHIPLIKVMSGSEEVSPFYSKFIPKQFISNDYCEKEIEALFKRQIHVLQLKRSDPVRYRNLDPRVILIIDDLLQESKKIQNDKMIKTLFYNGRHYQITLVLVMQYSKGIPPRFRANVDYAFLFRENNYQARRGLIEGFSGVLDSNEFVYYMKHYTIDHQCMVIDLESLSDEILDSVYWYKAMKVPPFRMGPAQFWSSGIKLYNRSKANTMSGGGQNGKKFGNFIARVHRDDPFVRKAPE